MTNYKIHLGETLREKFLRMVEVAEQKNDRREIHLEQGTLILKKLNNSYTYMPTRWVD